MHYLQTVLQEDTEMIKVYFKRQEEIEETITSYYNEEDEEVKGTDWIKYVPDIVAQLEGQELHQVEKYIGKPVIAVYRPEGDVDSWISLKWVNKLEFNGKKYKIAPTKVKFITDDYLQINTKYVIDLKELEIIELSSLPICTECGIVISETESIDGMCPTCFTNKYIQVHNYSYKPTPKFIGEGAYYFGLELEIGYDDRTAVAVFMKGNKENVYLKSDSSIRGGMEGGVEVVSHPHTFEKLMDKGSFIHKIVQIPQTDEKENGFHIHVSRSAWTDDKHYALFYSLLEKMAEQGIVEKIGGRDFYHYCEFVKSNKHITSLKKDGKTGRTRSLWVNDRNDATIEFRYAKSTDDIDVIKANIQLLRAMIEYTRYHKKYVTLKRFEFYINKYSKKYKELVSLFPTIEDDSRVVYSTIKVKNVTLENLRYKDLKNIKALILTNGDRIEEEVRGVIDNFVRTAEIFGDIPANEIAYVEVLK